MRYKLTISYDGTNYNGFQSQPKGKTIAGEINKALTKIHKKEIKVTASGRTDSKVHALGQVVHFDSFIDIPENRFLKAINNLLPLDIRALEIKRVPADFHARYDARKKTYLYIISPTYDVFLRNYQTYFKYPLDLELMTQATKKFIGTHDFAGFSSYTKSKQTTKTIYNADLIQKDDKIFITIKGDGFIKYMVRRMVGRIISIATKKKPLTVIEEIFATRDSSLCGKTASPNGLYLQAVFY